MQMCQHNITKTNIDGNKSCYSCGMKINWSSDQWEDPKKKNDSLGWDRVVEKLDDLIEKYKI